MITRAIDLCFAVWAEHSSAHDNLDESMTTIIGATGMSANTPGWEVLVPSFTQQCNTFIDALPTLHRRTT